MKSVDIFNSHPGRHVARAPMPVYPASPVCDGAEKTRQSVTVIKNNSISPNSQYSLCFFRKCWSYINITFSNAVLRAPVLTLRSINPLGFFCICDPSTDRRRRVEDGGAPPLATYPVQLLHRVGGFLFHNLLIFKSVIFSLLVSLWTPVSEGCSGSDPTHTHTQALAVCFSNWYKYAENRSLKIRIFVPFRVSKGCNLRLYEISHNKWMWT